MALLVAGRPKWTENPDHVCINEFFQKPPNLESRSQVAKRKEVKQRCQKTTVEFNLWHRERKKCDPACRHRDLSDGLVWETLVIRIFRVKTAGITEKL